MTITTYVELQDTIGRFMIRDEYKSGGSEAAATKDFISLVESDLNSNPEFLLAFMESRITSTMTASSRYLGVPSDLKQVRDVILTGSDPDAVLEYVPPAEFSARFALAATGQPSTYTLIGDELKFGKTPDSPYAIEIDYFARIQTSGPSSKPTNQQPLSDTNTTNWILANQPDIYLFGALAVASKYAQAVGDLSGYPPLYERAVGKAILADRKRAYPRSTRRVRTLGSTP